MHRLKPKKTITNYHVCLFI